MNTRSLLPALRLPLQEPLFPFLAILRRVNPHAGAKSPHCRRTRRLRPQVKLRRLGGPATCSGSMPVVRSSGRQRSSPPIREGCGDRGPDDSGEVSIAGFRGLLDFGFGVVDVADNFVVFGIAELRSSTLARCMRVHGALFASKNIGHSQPVPLSQRRVSADQCQVTFPSPCL